MHKNVYAILLFIAAFILVGCQPQNSESSPAGQALVAYLNALVDKDETTLTLLSCADWESSALLEMDSFQSVETGLEDLNCQQTATGAGTATVNCQGFILTSYGDEIQEYDLSQRMYHIVEAGGDWLVCGFD